MDLDQAAAAAAATGCASFFSAMEIDILDHSLGLMQRSMQLSNVML